MTSLHHHLVILYSSLTSLFRRIAHCFFIGKRQLICLSDKNFSYRWPTCVWRAVTFSHPLQNVMTFRSILSLYFAYNEPIEFLDFTRFIMHFLRFCLESIITHSTFFNLKCKNMTSFFSSVLKFLLTTIIKRVKLWFHFMRIILEKTKKKQTGITQTTLSQVMTLLQRNKYVRL